MIEITKHPTKFLKLLLLLVVSQQQVSGQYYFERELATPVSQNGGSLSMPWVGGLNGNHFSQMDLNADGELDLIVYDRSTTLIHCFLQLNGRYEYAPQYNNIFPSQINVFLQLADFNQDGKIDLFTAGNLGIVAYENVSTNNNFQWKKVSNFLTYESVSGNEVNLQINVNDYPQIADIDQDGDIDILNFNTNGLNSQIIFYENRSVDLSGQADIAQLFEANTNWGALEECNCGDFTFNGNDCNATINARGSSHAGGKSVFAADINNDNILELVTSHQECRDLYSFFGAQSGTNPSYSDFNNSLINNPQTPDQVLYPNTMPLFNQNKELTHLIVSPNLKAQLGIATDYQASNWLYALNENKEPELVKKNFLQEHMIDWGIQSSPSFWDYDNDGDLDLFLSYTNTDVVFEIYSAVALYENIGNATAPSFQLTEDDFLAFRSTALSNLLIQLVDINQDGLQDLAYQATENGQNSLWIMFGASDGTFNEALKLDNVFIGFGYSFHFTPILGGEAYDLLIGKSSGGLILYENISTSAAINFQHITNSFLSIDDDFFKSSIKVTTADLDANEQADLIVSDLSGVYKVYPNYLNETEQYDSIALPSQQSFFGQSNILTTAKLYDSQLPSIISGNLSGGLTILRNKIEFDESKGVRVENIKLFPNPTYGQFKLSLSKAANVSMIAVDGKLIFNSLDFDAGIHDLDLSPLRSGVYIITAYFKGGEVNSAKIVIK